MFGASSAYLGDVVGQARAAEEGERSSRPHYCIEHLKESGGQEGSRAGDISSFSRVLGGRVLGFVGVDDYCGPRCWEALADWGAACPGPRHTSENVGLECVTCESRTAAGPTSRLRL